MASDRSPRLRRAPLPDDAVLVVRGDVLDADLLRSDARRFSRRFPEWGRAGVSGFYARTEREIDAVCQGKLVNFETVIVFSRADLESVGVGVIGTFRTPHVTLAAPDIDALVEALLRCRHQVRTNPYHGNDTTTEEV